MLPVLSKDRYTTSQDLTIVHRDLSTLSRGASVNVRLKNGQLIVTNPGGLVGITTDQLGDQNARRPVNEHVYRLCQHYRFKDGTRLIEGEGGGIKWVRRELKAADLRPPRFYDKGVSFTAVISEESLLETEDLAWLAGVDPEGELTRAQRNILVEMRMGREWSNSEVRDAFGIDSVEARTELQTLVARGLADMDGTGRATVYRLADKSGDTERREYPGGPGAGECLQLDTGRSGGHRAENGTLQAGVLLGALEADGAMSVRHLQDVTNLSERQVRYALDRLEAAGRVKRGQGKPARWSLL